MYHKITLIAISALASIATCVNAQPASSFELTAPYADGPINVAPVKGQYVYKPPTTDNRRQTPPFMVGKPPRQDYVFFSAQEADALLFMADKAMEDQEKKQAAARRSLARTHVKYAWPRVVVRGKEICVPELPYSDGADWMDHLTCWTDNKRAGS